MLYAVAHIRAHVENSCILNVCGPYAFFKGARVDFSYQLSRRDVSRFRLFPSALKS